MASFLASGVVLDNSTDNTILFQDANNSYLALTILATIHGSATTNVDAIVSGSLGNFYLTKNNQVPAGESLELVANRVVIPSGQTLQVRASASGEMTVYTGLYKI